jgi:hypothetical protein
MRRTTVKTQKETAPAIARTCVTSGHSLYVPFRTALRTSRDAMSHTVYRIDISTMAIVSSDMGSTAYLDAAIEPVETGVITV